MRRRNAIVSLLGAPLAKPQSVATTHPEAIAAPKLVFFSAAEMETLRKLAGEIVPAMDGRPGALEAGAPEFLDFLLSKSTAKDQRLYRSGLASNPTVDLLNKPWSYSEPSDVPSRFMRRLKEDLLRATLNSRESAAQRRGSGTNYYWKPFD